MLTSNQRGRGNDPVVVLGRTTFAVAVNMWRESNYARPESQARQPWPLLSVPGW